MIDGAVYNRQKTIDTTMSVVGPVTEEMEVKEHDQERGLVDVMELRTSLEIGSQVFKAMRKVREAMSPMYFSQIVDLR